MNVTQRFVAAFLIGAVGGRVEVFFRLVAAADTHDALGQLPLHQGQRTMVHGENLARAVG